MIAPRVYVQRAVRGSTSGFECGPFHTGLGQPLIFGVCDRRS
jgi:hypothetical protein